MKYFRVIFSPVFSIIIFLFVFIPVYIWRGFVKRIIAKCALPQGSKIVEAGSATFSPTNCTVSPMSNVLISIVIKGELKKNNLLSGVDKVWQSYSEFTSYPQVFLGFAFWIPDDKFSVSNHLSYLRLSDDKKSFKSAGIQNEAGGYHLQTYTEEDIVTLKKIMIMESFPAKRSPWNIYAVQNVEIKGQRCTILLVRFHHGLSDGMSILKIAMSTSNNKTNQPTTTMREMGFMANTYITIKAILRISNVFFGGGESREESNEVSDNAPVSINIAGKNDFHILSSDGLEVSLIKKMKDLHKVPFAAITYYGYTTALRNYFLDRGRAPPAGVGNCFSPFPAPSHPNNKMTNHWTFAILPLPIDEANDEIRLQKIVELLQNSRTESAITFKLIRLLGSLLSAWQRLNISTVVSFSDFPGPTQNITALGGEWLDVSYLLHFLAGKQVIVPTGLTYNGTWKLSFLVSGSMFESSKEGNAFIHSIQRSIRDLEFLKGKAITKK